MKLNKDLIRDIAIYIESTVNVSKEISIYAKDILNVKNKTKNTKYSEIYAESLVRYYFLKNSLVENIVLLIKEEGIL